MLYGVIPGIERPTSRVVLGTSGMRSYEQAAPLLDAFVGHGGTCLDTAFVYGGGTCETVVGRWLSGSGSTSSVVLIVKGAHPPRCRPECVRPELLVSLERLGVHRVDLYMLHRDDHDVPIDEWVDALEAEVAVGRIGAYGASNWSPRRVEEGNAYAAASGARGLVSLSNHFSLAQMAEPLYPGCAAVDEGDLVWLKQHGVALFPWSSQARGFFSDVAPALLDPNMRRCWDTPSNRARRDRAETVASAIGVRTVNVALAFVLAQQVPTFPVIGPRDDAELAVALRALDVELGDDVTRWLTEGGRPPVL